MKKLSFCVLLFVQFSFQLLIAQNLIQNPSFEDDLTNWESKVANTDYGANFNIITTDFHTGSKSLHVDVTKILTTEYWAFRYHNIRIKQTGFTSSDGDIFIVRFWAKCLNPGETHPMIQAGLARNVPEQTDFWLLEDYDMSNFWISDQWKQYEMKLLITKNVGSDIELLLRFGGMTGNYYVDDIELIKTASFSSQNNWLSDYQKRIDTLRKGNIEFTILDNFGNKMKGVKVTVNLLRHNFTWGTSVRSVTPSDFNNTTYQWERTEILKLFNSIVNENDFKWPQTEGTQGSVNYANVNLYLDWKNNNSLQYRGHALYWTKQMYMPAWWPALTVPQKISAIQTRCTRDPNYYKGRVPEYDVVNEPLHFPYVEDAIGDSIYKKSFNWVHQTDSQANLYVNEWWNVDKWDSWRLKTWTQQRLSEGAHIDGIGFQAHWDNERVDWREVKFKSDYIAELGLKLKITEFDMDYTRIGMTRTQQAEDYGKLIRLCFSHPAYEGFLIWGLKDGWRDNAGIYNDDNTPRASRDTMYKWIKQIWKTNNSGNTTVTGIYAFNGYLGDYEVTVEFNSVQKKYYVNATKNDLLKSIQTDFVTSDNTISSTNAQIKVYPNPAVNTLFVFVPENTLKPVTIRIYTINGSVVYNYLHQTNKIIQLNVSDLYAGKYILSVEIDNIVNFEKFTIIK